MRGLRRWLSRLGYLATRRRDEERMREEFEAHLAEQTAENLRAGMAAEEARRQAALKFGALEVVKEEYRDERRIPLIESGLQDLRYGLRALYKSPGFAAVAVVTLALGIGANTAIFSVIDAVALRALPVPQPSRLVLFEWAAHHRPRGGPLYMYGGCPGETGIDGPNPRDCTFPGPMIRELSDTTANSAQVFGFVPIGGLILAKPSGVGIARTAYAVSGSFFPALGLAPAAGRLLGPADNAPNAPPAVVLSYAYWQRRFGGAAAAIGSLVTLDRVPARVVGVAPEEFEGIDLNVPTDLYVPLAFEGRLRSYMPSAADARAMWIEIGARLRPGVSMARMRARADAAFISAAIAAGLFTPADGARLLLLPAARGLANTAGSTFARPLTILMCAAGLVLLIACANIAGLLLARAPTREREMAVRLALGAGRGRIVRQLFTESLLLAVVGAALGILLAFWVATALADRLAASAYSIYTPLRIQIGPDPAVLGFTAAVATLAAVLFGLTPALRGSAVAPAPALRLQPGQAGRRRRRLSLGGGLVIGQVALAVIVLAGAGLLVRTLAELESVKLGFDARNLLLVNVDAALTGLKGPSLDHLYGGLERRLAALPGVTEVSWSNMPLLSGSYMEDTFRFPGQAGKKGLATSYIYVGPGFFSTLHIPLLAGRAFTPADLAAKRNLAIVNRKFAREAFGTADPIGQRVQGNDSDWQIVGVAADAKYDDLRSAITPTAYLLDHSGYGVYALRTALPPAALMASVRRAVREVNPQLAISQMLTQRAQIAQTLWQERLLADLSSLFGALALALAALGLYGLLAFEVAQRRREIGIRMALGAAPGPLVASLLRRGLALALGGACLGVIGAALLTRSLHALVFGISTLDPLSYTAALLLLASTAAAACYFPARRAAGVDPMVALREE